VAYLIIWSPIPNNFRTNQGILYRPSLIYPVVNIKRQLQRLYNKKGFEESCRKWAARPNNNQELLDIYDGRIWKEFKGTNENQLFFRREVSDSHLGIMLNLDWFQPFDNSQYSVGVMYGVICNLPRSERFKTSNIITLAVIPGPNEPKLHQLNHYLAPIIDQLIELWGGIELSATYENSNGRSIRAAVICCACDIPAARKLCGHISARIACHRCEKVANFDIRNQPNFGGFDDMEQWFVKRNVDEVRNNAGLWKECTSEDARKRHVSETLVRWSEMCRLPYFDPVQFLIVDPMHCLFLGIAKWIVTRLWIEEGRLTSKHLEIMQARANKIKVPSDIGRIPNKIATGEGFSGFTADQWKTFILIYATTITWDLLKDEDRKILSYFVRACNILVCRIISKSALNEAHQCLLSMVKLVEKQYGPEKITPNMHLCLHICECALDYGPLYSFWYYSFERMNGLLGSFYSSNRHIEPELLRIVQHYSILDELSASYGNVSHLSTCLPYIAFKESVGSLATYDEFDLMKYSDFLTMSKNVAEKAGVVSESFPGKLLNPSKEANLLSEVVALLVEYYNNAYMIIHLQSYRNFILHW
jgi:Transposase family tnp2